jgi:excisionase family DNA binding protein
MRARTIARMPYVRVAPSERRRMLARKLYAEQPRARPDWIDDQLLRPGQVAALFQVSRRTVSDWARAGKLEAIITPGGHRRFRGREVRALLEAQKVTGANS